MLNWSNVLSIIGFFALIICLVIFSGMFYISIFKLMIILGAIILPSVLIPGSVFKRLFKSTEIESKIAGVLGIGFNLAALFLLVNFLGGIQTMSETLTISELKVEGSNLINDYSMTVDFKETTTLPDKFKHLSFEEVGSNYQNLHQIKTETTTGLFGFKMLTNKEYIFK